MAIEPYLLFPRILSIIHINHSTQPPVSSSRKLGDPESFRRKKTRPVDYVITCIPSPRAPRTFLEGVWGGFRVSKYLLSRYLEP